MSMHHPLVRLEDIRSAARRIEGKVVRTPTVLSPSLTETCGVPVHLKLEHNQTTGSFKLRGATNAVLGLSAAEKARGVVAASTGNHGRALAHAAKTEGSVATICLSRLVPDNKVREIRRLGANVKIIGTSQDEAQEEVDRLVETEGLVMLPPFDHPDIIAGQGTIGLEILEDLADAATILVPLSGGGLISGIAAAIKALRPDIRIIGISMDRGAAMRASLDAGKPVQVEEYPSLADSLGGGIGLDNNLTLAMCQTYVDDAILLTEAEIAAGMRHAYENEREIIEGGGAVGIGALLAGKVQSEGPVVVLLSGRNVDMDVHRRVINGDADPLAGGGA